MLSQLNVFNSIQNKFLPFLIIITKLFKIIIIILLAFYNILIVKPILKSKGIC